MCSSVATANIPDALVNKTNASNATKDEDLQLLSDYNKLGGDVINEIKSFKSNSISSAPPQIFNSNISNTHESSSNLATYIQSSLIHSDRKVESSAAQEALSNNAVTAHTQQNVNKPLISRYCPNNYYEYLKRENIKINKLQENLKTKPDRSISSDQLRIFGGRDPGRDDSSQLVVLLNALKHGKPYLAINNKRKLGSRHELVVSLISEYDGLPVINLKINGSPYRVLLDSGATNSIFSERCMTDLGGGKHGDRVAHVSSPILDSVMTVHIGTFELCIGDRVVEWEACIIKMSGSNPFDAILGYDFFRHHNVILMPEDRQARISLLDSGVLPGVAENGVIATAGVGPVNSVTYDIPLHLVLKESCAEELILHDSCSVSGLPSSPSVINLVDNTSIKDGQSSNPTKGEQSLALPRLQSIFSKNPAYSESNFCVSKDILPTGTPDCIHDNTNTHTYLWSMLSIIFINIYNLIKCVASISHISNFLKGHIENKLKRGKQPLCILSTNIVKTDTPLPSSINMLECDEGASENLTCEQIFELIDFEDTSVSEQTNLGFRNLISEYKHILIEDVSKIKGATVPPIKCKFTSDTPIFTKQYPIAYSQRGALMEKLKRFEEAGIISRAESSWNVPLLVVKKEDGDIRIVLDLRKINEITQPMPYPIWHIHEILGQLHGNNYFSKIDMNNGYYNLSLDPEIRERFSFMMPWSRYILNRLPQGSVIAASAFQKTMNELFNDMMASRELLIYQDDCLLFSRTQEEHLELLERFFERLGSVNMAAKPSKCHFFKESVTFLGHVVSREGAKPMDIRIKAIRDFPRPSTVKHVRSFMGTVNFYRKFIPHITEKATPLYNLIRKGKGRINWDDSCEDAFVTLKNDLTSAPLLIYPDFTKPFYIKADSSLIGVGGVLEQELDGSFRPIAYCSRKLNKAERNYSIVELESLALVFALAQFRFIVYGFPIVVLTDHRPITYMLKLKDTNQRIVRWLLQLQDYNLIIQHISGKQNVVADMLSRPTDKSEDVKVCSLSLDEVGITVQMLKESQNRDSMCQEIYGAICSGGSEDNLYILDNDQLIMKNIFQKGNEGWGYRVVVPEDMVGKIIQHYHDSRYGGHFGAPKVTWRIKKLFTWPSIFSDIRDYVKSCESCQKRNLHNRRAPLQPVTPPSFPFQKLSVDIIGPFSQTERGNRYILLWVDHFTRYPIASVIPTQDAATIAQEYLTWVYSYYGGSQVILSDRGANFTSSLFKSMCEKLGTRNLTTTSFKPNSNGVNERMNKTVINILSHICNSRCSDWDLMLSHVLREIRSTPHSSTGETPAYLLHGYDPIDPQVEMTLPREDRVYYNIPDFVETMTDRMHYVRSVISDNLIKASQYYCSQKNKGKTLQFFFVGQRVWCLDKTSFSGKNRKFNKRYKGPYRIIQRQGPVNYKIVNVRRADDIQLVHFDKLKLAYERHLLNDGPSTHSQAKKMRGTGIREASQHRFINDEAEEESIIYYMAEKEDINQSESIDASSSVVNVPVLLSEDGAHPENENTSGNALVNEDTEQLPSRSDTKKVFIPNFERPHTRAHGPLPGGFNVHAYLPEGKNKST